MITESAGLPMVPGVPGLVDWDAPKRWLTEEFSTEVAEIDDALERFRAAERGLLDEQARPIYSKEQHERRLAGHRASAAQTFDRLERAADAAIAEAERRVTKLAADPTAGLSTQELERANQRRALVNEDAETLPLAALRDRIKAVLEGGSKIEALLYGRALERRLASLTEQARRTGGRLILVADDERALPELRQAVEALRQKVQPGDARETREAAQRRITAAQFLRGRVAEARAALGNTSEAQAAAAYVRRNW